MNVGMCAIFRNGGFLRQNFTEKLGGGKMTYFQVLSYISNKVPFLKENEKKKILLEVVGALVLRIISLRKAAEVLDIEEQTLLKILDSVGYPFSYLEDEDIAIECEWKV